MNYKKVPARDIPCFSVYSDDFHYSDAWLNKMVSLWVAVRQDFINGDLPLSEYRERLTDGIIVASGGWRTEFRQAATEVGANPDNEKLFDEYVALHRGSAFDLIPRGAHAELCWIPDWSGGNLDDLMETHGLRSARYRSTYLNDVEPGHWLVQLLRMVNVGSEALIAAGIEERGEEGRAFAEKCRKQKSFKVLADPSRPSVMTPFDVITTIENSYPNAVPIMHCEVAVRTLFDLDPRNDIQFSSNRGEVHVGLHDFVLNGAGHMDTYKGVIAVPAKSKGFVGAPRMHWTINSVYGLVRSCFYTTPTHG